jgi:uncharacterized protein
MTNHLPILGRSPTADVSAPEAEAKLQRLRGILAERVSDGVLVAFSGGMDSAFLLWAAVEAKEAGGGRVVALTTTSASTPSRDKADARAFTKRLGVDHFWEESAELSSPGYLRNDRERCYHCKTELFRIAADLAEREDLRWLLYGYNASDQGDDRPGHRAAMEAGVVTPLSDVGLSKAEIGYLMAEAGLPLAGKPASPCLSSRIMTGIEIDPGKLRDVEELEGLLRRHGVSNHRVRVCRDDDGTFFLRVEAPPQFMTTILDCREDLLEIGSARGYRWVTLDLGGYRTGGGVK